MLEDTIICNGYFSNKMNHFFCIRCEETGKIQSERDVCCPKCGNHRKVFAKANFKRMEIKQMENDENQLTITFQIFEYNLIRNGEVIQPLKFFLEKLKRRKDLNVEFQLEKETESILKIDKKNIGNLYAPVNSELLTGIDFDCIEVKDLEKILKAFDDSYVAKSKQKGRQVSNAIYFEKFPKMKIFGPCTDYNIWENTVALAVEEREKELEILKYFIPKVTKTNMHLVKTFFQKEGEQEFDLLSPYVLYSIQKPETVSNLFKVLNQFEGCCGLNLQAIDSLDKLKTNTNKVLRHITPDGYDKSLNHAIRRTLETQDIHIVQKKMNEIKMLLWDTKIVIEILEERIKRMKKNDQHYEEVESVVKGTYQTETLKQLHDELSMLEIKSNPSYYEIPTLPWQKEMTCTVDGYEFFFVKDTTELRCIAKEMHNCISSLESELVYGKNTRLYGVRKDGETVFMMKLYREKNKLFIENDDAIQITEAKKKRNCLLSEQDKPLIEVIEKVIQMYRLKVYTSDLAVLEREGNYVK